MVAVISSDKLSKVEKVVNGLELPFDYAISDPLHKVTNLLKSKKLMSPIITGKNGDEGYAGNSYTAYANKRGHKEGLLQPMVLVLSQDEVPLFQWRIEPKLSNLGGATDRPDIVAIVNLILEKAKGERALDEVTTLEELRKVAKVSSIKPWDLRSIRYFLRGIKAFKKSSKHKKLKKSSTDKPTEDEE